MKCGSSSSVATSSDRASTNSLAGLAPVGRSSHLPFRTRARATRSGRASGPERIPVQCHGRSGPARTILADLRAAGVRGWSGLQAASRSVSVEEAGNSVSMYAGGGEAVKCGRDPEEIGRTLLELLPHCPMSPPLTPPRPGRAYRGPALQGRPGPSRGDAHRRRTSRSPSDSRRPGWRSTQ